MKDTDNDKQAEHATPDEVGTSDRYVPWPEIEHATVPELAKKLRALQRHYTDRWDEVLSCEDAHVEIVGLIPTRRELAVLAEHYVRDCDRLRYLIYVDRSGFYDDYGVLDYACERLAKIDEFLGGGIANRLYDMLATPQHELDADRAALEEWCERESQQNGSEDLA